MALTSIPPMPAAAARAAEAAFGRPLVTNVLRGLLVEAIVAGAIEPVWRWCSEDYASWDFDRADGLRLEVKQSAARQSWSLPSAPASACSFDIRTREGRWEDAVWVAERGRAAQVYVFAHHPVVDESADHRDPQQWRFHVVSAGRLPSTKRLGLAALVKLAASVGVADLPDTVGSCCAALAAPRNCDDGLISGV
jgi:hypothetical protein